MLLIAMENIYLFYENKAGRGTAKQTHIFKHLKHAACV